MVNSEIREFDVAIVGSSLAGSSLALRLGCLGLRVALLDRSDFPRRKPCGEGLSVQGVELLRELGVIKRLPQSARSELHSYKVWRADSCCELPINSRLNSCEISPSSLGVKREILDELIFDMAIEQDSVEAFLGSNVLDVKADESGVKFSCGNLLGLAGVLVLACGANSNFFDDFELSEDGGLVSKLKIPLFPTKPWCPSERVGFSIEASGISEAKQNSVHIILGKDRQVCCTPTGLASMNLAILSKKGSRPNFSDPEFRQKLFAEVERRTGFRVLATDAGRGVGRLGTGRRKAYSGRIVLVGDAVEQLDPIGGMGMTHALLSSKLLSQRLDKVFRQECDIASAFCAYAEERERAVRPFRAFTSLSYLSLVNFQQLPLVRRVEAKLLAEYLSRAIHRPIDLGEAKHSIPRQFLSFLGATL